MKANQVIPPERRSRFASTTSEKPEKAISVRDSLVWDLRRKGYRFREIGAFLGVTKQRVCQIERRLNQLVFPQGQRDQQNAKELAGIRHHGRMPVHVVSMADFDRRLDALNKRYERGLQNILERRRSHSKFKSRKHISPLRETLFRKVWPCVERYSFKPFSYSQLVADYPQLAREALLAQLLSRLRKKGLLQNVGSVRIEGHNLPEILMTETPVEQYVGPLVESLVVRWSKELRTFRQTYLPTIPSHSIDSLRESVMQNLMRQRGTILELGDVRFNPGNSSRRHYLKTMRNSSRSLGK